MIEIKSNADIGPCLTAVMPVYNESATVAEVVRVVLTQRPVQQLVIVDDCSRDDTWENFQPLAKKEPRIKLVRHEIEPGQGCLALRTGIVLMPPRIMSSFRMRTWNMTPPNITGCWHPSSRAGRMWSLGPGFAAATTPIGFCITGTPWATTFSRCARTWRLQFEPPPTWRPATNLSAAKSSRKIPIEENRFGFEPEIIGQGGSAESPDFRGRRLYNRVTALMLKARRSAGATVSGRSGASSNIIFGAAEQLTHEQPTQRPGANGRF